jgi:UDP-2-acetamido-3-amino-2,3-dideoxy-glucuronate N-acetyltransferase
VINKNAPDHALVVGNPAKQIGWICRCGERLTDDLECLTCGQKYQPADVGNCSIFYTKINRINAKNDWRYA